MGQKKPKGGPQAAGAMVPSKVVKAGGAGLADAECAQIFQQFDPPIIVGTYDTVTEHRRADREANGDQSPYRNSQSEHQVANSCFQEERGKTNTNIDGCDNYTEGGAPAYNLYDDQSAGTEHKVLTDAARTFMQNNPTATLGQYLDNMEQKTAAMLNDPTVQRRSGQGGRVRATDASKSKELAEAAAKCLKQHAERTYANMGISRSQPLRNGFGSPPAMPRTSSSTGSTTADV